MGSTETNNDSRNYAEYLASAYSSVRRAAKRRLRTIVRPRTNRPYNKVFCVGWLKTGTTSFGHAMRRLGFKHCGWDPVVWEWYQNGEKDRVLKHAEFFESFDDLPWNKHRFLKRLDGTFPNSKYVLLERDPNDWLASLQSFRHRTGKTDVDPENAIEHYAKRNRLIKDYFKKRPGDLLIMEVCEGDGYEKLCPFLNVPTPDESFPHISP